jgi:hypothetical protein
MFLVALPGFSFLISFDLKRHDAEYGSNGRVRDDDVADVHVMNRVVCRCELLNGDPVAGKNYDHRTGQMESPLQRLGVMFGGYDFMTGPDAGWHCPSRSVRA